MEKEIRLYHGSDHIVEHPTFGAGKVNNDFGQGFYCTQNKELAKEWAVSSLGDGFANCYELDAEYLQILRLNSAEYSILNWIAVLVEHRNFSLRTPVARKAKQYLVDNFAINVNAYDLIIGNRADDSYFDYAESFLNNGITVEQLSAAMKLGKLGEQYVLKSKYAFSKLSFLGAEPASRNLYLQQRNQRNTKANQQFAKILEENTDGLYINDIMRGGFGNEDPRIPRNIPE